MFRKTNWKVPQKHFQTHHSLDGHSGNGDWGFVIFKQLETHEQLKKPFGNTDLKPFTQQV